MLGIQKSNTTPWHPEGNGATDRFNKTLLGLLRTLDPAEKHRWKDHIPMLTHAYNCCRNESTKFSPYYLLFGRVPRLALDIFLGKPVADNMSSTARSIRDNLEAAYQAVSTAVEKARKKQAHNYNKKVRGMPIEVGDLVLVRNTGLKGKHKIADKWKSELYIVVEKPNDDLPVFKIRPESGGAEKILHRNNLLPLALPWPRERSEEVASRVDGDRVESDSEDEEVVRRVTRSRTRRRVDSVDSSEQSEEEFEVQITEQCDLPVPQVVDVRENEVVDEGEMVEGEVEMSEDDVDDVEESEIEEQEVEDDSVHSDVVNTNNAVDVPDSPSPVLRRTEDPPAVVTSPERSAHQDAPLPPPGNEQGAASDEPVLRRSTRPRGPPIRLGDYYCSFSRGQTVVLLEWQRKVAALLQLLPLFPLAHADIANAILYVVTHG